MLVTEFIRPQILIYRGIRFLKLERGSSRNPCGVFIGCALLRPVAAAGNRQSQISKFVRYLQKNCCCL
jgi:hypothetical protein